MKRDRVVGRVMARKPIALRILTGMPMPDNVFGGHTGRLRMSQGEDHRRQEKAADRQPLADCRQRAVRISRVDCPHSRSCPPPVVPRLRDLALSPLGG